MQMEYSSPYRANGLSSNLPHAGADKLSAVAQTLAEGLVQVWCSAANGRRADRHASVSIVGVCGEARGGVGPAHRQRRNNPSKSVHFDRDIMVDQPNSLRSSSGQKVNITKGLAAMRPSARRDDQDAALAGTRFSNLQKFVSQAPNHKEKPRNKLA